MSVPLPELLGRVRAGDQTALNALVPVLYDELHRIASRHLRKERPDHTLQATALVHEAYLKLFRGQEQKITDKIHFLALSSRVMRQVLLDHARGRASKKRSSGLQSPLTPAVEVENESGIDRVELIDLDDALKALAIEDESLAGLVEMRYFGGMTSEEIAEVLGLPVHVVRRDARLAQAWLRRKLNE